MNEELKPCPICGEKVNANEHHSPDKTIKWITISHSPTVPCGISFIDDASIVVEKWNKRQIETK